MTDNPILIRINSERILALNTFSKAIDTCRSELTQTVVQEEATYRYAIIRTYSSILLTCYEIYTLLNAGYPKGAFALSRSLHEAMIIIAKLLDGYSTNDMALLQRFFDAADVTRIQIGITSAEWVLEKAPKSQAHREYLSELYSELQHYKDKYPGEKFSSYWWADERTFRALADNSGFTKDFYYKYACENMHFNAFSVFNYLDNSEDMLLIGATSNGFEVPLWYSSHCLSCIVSALQNKMPDLVSIDTIPTVINAQQSAASLLRKIALHQSPK